MLYIQCVCYSCIRKAANAIVFPLQTADDSLRRSFSIRKADSALNVGPGGGDPAPYPGVVIEEMLDSASMHDANEVKQQDKEEVSSRVSWSFDGFKML